MSLNVIQQLGDEIARSYILRHAEIGIIFCVSSIVLRSHLLQFPGIADKDEAVRFSAYRVHAGFEPFEFEGSEGYASVWRNGEPGHGVAPAAVNASTFALVYEWEATSNQKRWTT